MADKARTTETLRSTLFDVIDDLRDRKIEVKEAKAVCDIAGRIIETADLEITVAKTYADIDKKDVDISIGAYLLTAPDDKECK